MKGKLSVESLKPTWPYQTVLMEVKITSRRRTVTKGCLLLMWNHQGAASWFTIWQFGISVRNASRTFLSFSLSVSHMQRQILDDRGDYKHSQQGGSRYAPSSYICGMTENLLNNLTDPQQTFFPPPLCSKNNCLANKLEIRFVTLKHTHTCMCNIIDKPAGEKSA